MDFTALIPPRMVVLLLLGTTVPTIGGCANAKDRQDSQAMVGSWSGVPAETLLMPRRNGDPRGPLFTFHFNKDGTGRSEEWSSWKSRSRTYNTEFTWRVSDGWLIIDQKSATFEGSPILNAATTHTYKYEFEDKETLVVDRSQSGGSRRRFGEIPGRMTLKHK